MYEGQGTKRFGFLLYMGIANKGKRITTLTSWRLQVVTSHGESPQLKPLTIPEPMLISDSVGKKFAQVLGVRGQYFLGETTVRPGESISGFVYYVYEYWGDKEFGPKITNDKIHVTFRVQDVFRKKKKVKIQTSEKPLSEIERIIPEIATIN
ncbi:hypothetical protein EDM68_01605 [Candidatus Uhrbacteria bacterium]|nr:MAG: hypothetical protein EDM68_01605 [Candidatus Uhrbacteria bacterium]